MFIVIYKEGTQHDTPLTKTTYEQAVAMPGEKYIFEWGANNQYIVGLNIPHGLWFDNCLSVKPFIHGDYQLTSVRQPNNKKPELEFVFRYKTVEDAVMRFSIRNSSMSQALTQAIREIMLASRFNSWADYQKHSATRDEVEQLKSEVAKLQTENEELRQKLSVSAQN